MSFKEIKFPLTYSYSSDSKNLPLEFYYKVFPLSTRVDMFLGYFNSYTFSLLSHSFAEFIYNGGKVRIITNHHYSPTDKEQFFEDPEISNYSKAKNIINDLRKLQNTLDQGGQLFFDCLKFLKKKDRLSILPVSFQGSLAHRKNMLFFDGANTVLTQGSMNFTPNGLIKNGENFDVSASWGGIKDQARISDFRAKFEQVIRQENANYTYLNKNDIEIAIDDIGNKKDLKDLLKNSLDIAKRNSFYSNRLKQLLLKKENHFKVLIDKIESEPRFPFDEPRDYQSKAYDNWVKNDYKGLFAMATGTGKTITSLNCVLKEYKKTGIYRVIVLVPTLALISQWVKEVSKNFNFQNILECTSSSEWGNTLDSYIRSINLQGDLNFILITSYATFRGTKFQQSFKRIMKFDDLILIADEAHTLGAKGLLKVLPYQINKRIGLSATPKRPFDSEGEDSLNKFFNSSPPKYTFRYDMKKAIEDEVLCRYKYHPILVNLTSTELSHYQNYTRKLRRHIDPKTGRYKDTKEANLLLILRKNIIHKAANKLDAISDIVEEIGADKLEYCFVYVPEGTTPDYSVNDFFIGEDEINEKIIDNYAQLLANKYQFRLKKYTGNTTDRENILKNFEIGKLDMLLAMKCLDEGVDIPRAEYGIFCSSTGNPRQYVQRRGRLLRNHKDKKEAAIYDLIVFPHSKHTDIESEISNPEINIFKSELKRIINFTALAENRIDILERLNSLVDPLGINVYSLVNKELENYDNIK